VRYIQVGLLLLALAALAGCMKSPPAATAPPYQTTASIRELMEAEVDPSADALWDSVVTTITAAGEDDKRPHTPEEWKAVRRSALMLVESTNLLVMPGRRIAPANMAPVAGEPAASLLQQRLDANPAAFAGYAQALREVSLKALAAIDAQDSQRLFDVGGEIDQACEACHLVYWYPPDLTPQS